MTNDSFDANKKQNKQEKSDNMNNNVTAEKKFPDYYNKCTKKCPPEDATINSKLLTPIITAYRLCQDTTPRESDFHSKHLQDIAEGKMPNLNDPNQFSVSIFATKEAALKMRARHKHLLDNYKSLAIGVIKDSGGVIKKTGGPEHYDWWSYEDEKPHEYFNYKQL